MPSTTEPPYRSWTSRYENAATASQVPRIRQSFNRAHTSASPVAHILRTGIALSPLMLAEFVKDPDSRWRYTRMLILGGALLEQVFWAAKVHRRSKDREQQGHRR